jgi:predicted amidohydrolase YtcJ
MPSVPPPKTITAADVLATQRKLNAFGITSVRIPGSYKGEFFQALDAILSARCSGDLTLRYTIYLPGSGVRDPARIREIIAKSPLKQDEGDDWVRIGGIKLLVDGGFEGGHMSAPFAGEYGKGGTFYGLTVVPPKEYNAVVKTINDLGWRATTHAVGDAAVDQVLDAYEAADAERSLGQTLGDRTPVRHASAARAYEEARPHAVGAGSSLSRRAGAEELPGQGAREPDHAPEKLSRRRLPGGSRHRLAGGAL